MDKSKTVDTFGKACPPAIEHGNGQSPFLDDYSILNCYIIYFYKLLVFSICVLQIPGASRCRIKTNTHLTRRWSIIRFQGWLYHILLYDASDLTTLEFRCRTISTCDISIGSEIEKLKSIPTTGQSETGQSEKSNAGQSNWNFNAGHSEKIKLGISTTPKPPFDTLTPRVFLLSHHPARPTFCWVCSWATWGCIRIYTHEYRLYIYMYMYIHI